MLVRRAEGVIRRESDGERENREYQTARGKVGYERRDYARHTRDSDITEY